MSVDIKDFIAKRSGQIEITLLFGLSLKIGIFVRILLKYCYFSWIVLTFKQINFDNGRAVNCK